MTETFDYVIVGAGSAGCVLAARLAEAGHTVCVLEAGPKDINPYIHIPAGYVKNIFSSRLTWGFVSDVIPGTRDRRIALTQGRVVGGSSSINGMIYNRGQAADYDGWAALGNSGWDYQGVLPYFKKSETRIGNGDDAYRGRSGPLTVSDSVVANPLCDLFSLAAQQCGFAALDDYSGPRQEGVGPWQFTIDPRGFVLRRMSSARAYLYPALKTGKVSLRSDSPAVQVLFNGSRAVGVRYRAGGMHAPEKQVHARCEVILSSGALNTPRLLQISGIGPAEHLRQLGVDVVVHSPGVGANLSDHFQLRVAARVRGIETLNERGRGWPLVCEIAKWATGRPSLLSMGPVLMRLFARTDPNLPTADVQMSFTPASYQEGLPGLLDHYPGMTLGGYQQRPQSRGHVLATSRDIAVPPTIQPNYLSTPDDQAAMVFVIRAARQLLRAPAFAAHYVDEVFPGVNVQSDDEILDFARQHGSTAYHHTGTTRMGPDGDAMAVVDPQGRVRGAAGLRVADASIMPKPISGNTNAPAIMIGEKVADLMLRG